jgi:hypothetical protein
MIDIKLLRENPDLIRASQTGRGEDAGIVDRVLALDEKRRAAINEFEAFYTKNFTQSTIGSFCALVPSIFGAIGAFFTALDGIADLVNKLKNFALNFSLAGLLNQLKDNITKVLDKVIDKVKNIIENFSIADVISEVKTFIVEKIGGQFQKIKEAALKFFDPENLKNFKNKIQAIIDYAVGIFKNPTLEDIQFLLYRFCQFVSQVENGINAIKNPLDTFVNSYKDTISILTSNSAANSARSVTAGGIRYDLPARGTGINTSREIYTAAGDIPPMGPEDFQAVTPWNEGKGDSRVTFNGRWVAALGRDGWEKEIFVSRVFNKGPTLIIVKSTTGAIFGGYTS